MKHLRELIIPVGIFVAAVALHAFTIAAVQA
jgi:hypothetical protein